MGRSVSYPSGALVAFTHIEVEMDYHEFQDMLECERDYAMSLWPSLREADHWRGHRRLGHNNTSRAPADRHHR